jgi:prevent-host-death family protein
MKTISVSIAEGKKTFSRLIRETSKGRDRVVVTKRGVPAAVIVSYAEYRQAVRAGGYRKILESREVFAKAKVSAQQVYEASRKALEKRR